MIATRDTTIEISETAKELRDRGVIKDTATNIEETAVAAREIGETAKRYGTTDSRISSSNGRGTKKDS